MISTLRMFYRLCPPTHVYSWDHLPQQDTHRQSPAMIGHFQADMESLMDIHHSDIKLVHTHGWCWECEVAMTSNLTLSQEKRLNKCYLWWGYDGCSYRIFMSFALSKDAQMLQKIACFTFCQLSNKEYKPNKVYILKVPYSSPSPLFLR